MITFKYSDIYCIIPMLNSEEKENTFYFKVNESSEMFYDNKTSQERGDSGINIKFAEDDVIPPVNAVHGIPTIIDFNVCVRSWNGESYNPFMLVPRSSISKTPLGLANSIGVIDMGYQGSLKVAIRNYSDEAFAIHKGESLFQIIRHDMKESHVEVVDDNHHSFRVNTIRDSGGFGSTGI